MKHSEKILLSLLFFIVFFCVFSISYYAIRTSSDEFWHIKTGEYIVQHGYHLPQKDIFTYTASNLDWVNHEWLSQILLYHVYHNWDFPGVVTFKTILILIAFLAVYAVVYQRCKNHYISLTVTLLAALTSRHTLYPRPFIFSYIMVPVYLYFLYEIVEKGIKKYHYFIFPLLMIPWVNLHGGAILGLLLIGFFLAGEILNQMILSKFNIKNSQFTASKNLLIIFILTLLASLVNPYGLKVFELTFKVMTDKLLVASIGELHPPELDKTLYYDIMLPVTILVVILTIKRLKSWDFILLLFFGWQSWTAVRNLPLFAITSASILASHLNISLTTFKDYLAPLKSINFVKIASTVLILILAFSILFHYHQLGLNIDMWNGPGYWSNNYPVRACNFILQNDFHGNMFNEINFSGYLMFALYPKHLVFTDNRFDLLGSKFLPDFYEITEVGPQWQVTLDKYTVNFIILERDNKLSQTLTQSQSWTRVYLDQGYNIFVKNIPDNKDLIQRCRESLIQLGLAQ